MRVRLLRNVPVMRYVNLTPHAVTVTGWEPIPPSGTVARVEVEFSEFDPRTKVSVARYGRPLGVPEPEEGTFYIVSAMVSQAMPTRNDVVAPATGHPSVVRDAKGQIVSVPGFVLC